MKSLTAKVLFYDEGENNSLLKTYQPKVLFYAESENNSL